MLCGPLTSGGHYCTVYPVPQGWGGGALSQPARPLPCRGTAIMSGGHIALVVCPVPPGAWCMSFYLVPQGWGGEALPKIVCAYL